MPGGHLPGHQDLGDHVRPSLHLVVIAHREWPKSSCCMTGHTATLQDRRDVINVGDRLILPVQRNLAPGSIAGLYSHFFPGDQGLDRIAKV